LRIFLTGATGFLGSRTAQEFIRRGHRLKLLVRHPADASRLQSSGAELIQGSLPDLPDLHDALRETDAVIHIAGVLKGLRDRDFFRVNESGTKRLAEAALVHGETVKLFLHVSTVAVHNSARDGEDFCLPPETCHPVSIYGKSKLAGEKTLSLLRGKIKTLILRPPVIYGPGDRELLPLFKAVRHGAAPVFGNGQNRLSVCHVEEVARAIADLTESSPASGEIFCVDDGEIHTWESIAREIGKAIKKTPSILKVPPFLFGLAAFGSAAFARLTRRPQIFTPDKMKEMRQANWVCGHKKIGEAIGWNPRKAFQEGARETFEFYRKEGWIS